MSTTVAAALKKIAVALLTDKKTVKKLGIFILSVFVGLIMPIAAILGICSSRLEFTEDQFDAIIDSLDSDALVKIASIQETLDEIEDAMEDADMHSRHEEAQILYMMALYEYQDEDDFVDRLVGCFEEDQSDYELIEAVNDEFDCDIDPTDYLNVVTGMRRCTISRFIFTDPYTKNNIDLVAWSYEALNDRWGYVWGSYGLMLTQSRFDALCEMYPDHVENHHEFIQENWVGRRTTDCAGLIKGYMWYNPEIWEIEYEYNGYTDYNANDLFDHATVSGTIDTMPDIPGLGLWKDGHAGVYVGNGKVIHSAGTETGVVIANLEDTSFTHWFEVPGMIYPEIEEDPPEETEPTETTVETTAETTVETTSETTVEVTEPIETTVEATEVSGDPPDETTMEEA